MVEYSGGSSLGPRHPLSPLWCSDSFDKPVWYSCVCSSSGKCFVPRCLYDSRSWWDLWASSSVHANCKHRVWLARLSAYLCTSSDLIHWESVGWFNTLLSTRGRWCGAARVHEKQTEWGAQWDASRNQGRSPKHCAKAALWPYGFSNDDAQVTALLCQARHPCLVQYGCRARGKCKGCKCGRGISTASLVPLRITDRRQKYCWCAAQSCWGDMLFSTLYLLISPDTWTPKAFLFKVIHPVTLKSWLLSGMIWSEVASGQALPGAGLARSAISATTL